jgi:uncharacterized membrane protein
MTETIKRNLPIWLIVSLIVNALLIGLLVGGGLRQKGSQSGGPSGGERAFVESIDRVVADEDRAAVRFAFRSAYGESRDARRAVRDARQALAEIIAADVYNEAAVIAAFGKMRAADDAAKAALHDALAAQLGGLTKDQRAAVLSNLERGGRQKRGERRDRGERPPRD